MSVVSVDAESVKVEAGLVSIKSVGIPVKIAFSFGNMMTYLHSCATCVDGNRRNYEDLVGWCCCFICPNCNFGLAKFFLKMSVLLEVGLVTLLVVNFIIGFFGNCTHDPAVITAYIGLGGTLLYFLLQLVIIIYVYVPTCFLFAANLGLFYSNLDFGDYCNDFFVISITAAVAQADRVRCRYRDTTTEISHEIIQMTGKYFIS